MKSFAAAAVAFLGLASALPAAVQRRGPIANIVPDPLSQYNVWTGAIDFDTHKGLVFKNNGASADKTTLVTFTIPSVYKGKTCSLKFDASGVGSSVSGSGLVDAFVSFAPVEASTTGWPYGNLRNNFVGRLQVDPNTLIGSYVSGFPNVAESFPCPAGTIAGELVGVYDVDIIQWSEGAARGAYIEIS